MNLRSIRVKLSLTYAGIALITALVSGGTLTLILRKYYQAQEQAYLRKNATAISSAIIPLLAQKVPLADLKPHLTLFSFLSQTHVRLFDSNGVEVGNFNNSITKDSSAILSAVTMPKIALIQTRPASPGETDSTYGIDGALGEGPVTLSGQRETMALQIVLPDKITSSGGITATAADNMKFFYGNPDAPAGGSIAGQGFLANNPEGKPLVSVFSAAGTMFGFDLQPKTTAVKLHSNQVFRENILNADGSLLGSLELSDGPAYGSEIVGGVARGWFLASVIAVLIAGLGGLFISRRLSAPLLVLTESTERMASGDLSARAGLLSGDEFGALAHSFNTMACRIEETVAALRRFVADAAHELQTPITALRTNLELAREETELGRQIAYLENAQAQVSRLNHLVKNLLDLSRLDAGVDSSQYIPLDLVGIARQVCEPFAAQAEQAGIELTLQAPEEAVTICADAKQLQHALGNLLDNALKFTPEGGAVTVSIEKVENEAYIRVEDTGMGIPPEDLGRLFERFHRGQNASGYPGSGLGLSIVKAIAQAHGGRVFAENTSPGARFTLCLPI